MLQETFNKICEITFEKNKDRYNISDINDWKYAVYYSLKKWGVMIIYLISVFLLSKYFYIEKIELFNFLLIFYILRSVMGGFHFDNEIVCFIVSLVIPLILLSIKIENILILQFIGTVILAAIGTIDNKNRRLSKEKKEKFKKNGMIILIILSANIFFESSEISKAVILIAISCLMGEIKNKKEGWEMELEKNDIFKIISELGEKGIEILRKIEPSEMKKLAEQVKKEKKEK